MRSPIDSHRKSYAFTSRRGGSTFRRLALTGLGVAAALLILLSWGPVSEGGGTMSGPSATVVPASSETDPGLPGAELVAQSILRPGYVLVLASWRCSFPRLEQVNEVALDLIETPLTELTEQGELIAWGQFNGGFRDEFNYHTYYIAESMEDYRSAIGRVLTFMNQEVPDRMNEFYDLCSSTRDTRVTVVTARP